jgi:hypothetical protein
MPWFPSNRSPPEEGWRFDIISLVAVVGGSTVAKHRQAITASRFGNIPRLMPAPDTFLDTDRPVRLPSVGGIDIFGVHSGNHFTELNFFADVIHNTQSLKRYEFLAYEITYRQRDEENPSNTDGEKANNKGQRASIPQHPFSFLNMVTVVSIGMTVGLFIWAALIHDGVALLGIGTMSLSTSTACLSGRWRPTLTVRPTGAKVPPGDVVIKTRGGAFIVVRCAEEIARELYGGIETCDYVYEGSEHQLLLACSTILLLASILFLSNSGWTMQLAIGLAYIILNVLYWVMSLITTPEKIWDTARYNVKLLKATPPHVVQKRYGKRKEVELDVSERRYATKDTELVKPKKREKREGEQDGELSFTETLWWAIRETEEIDWVRKHKIAPDTPNWDGWLQEAKANSKNPDWDAVEAKDRWMVKELRKTSTEVEEIK